MIGSEIENVNLICRQLSCLREFHFMVFSLVVCELHFSEYQNATLSVPQLKKFNPYHENKDLKPIVIGLSTMNLYLYKHYKYLVQQVSAHLRAQTEHGHITNRPTLPGFVAMMSLLSSKQLC